jgi:hypothetical protein
MKLTVALMVTRSKSCVPLLASTSSTPQRPPEHLAMKASDNTACGFDALARRGSWPSEFSSPRTR